MSVRSPNSDQRDSRITQIPQEANTSTRRSLPANEAIKRHPPNFNRRSALATAESFADELLYAADVHAATLTLAKKLFPDFDAVWSEYCTAINLSHETGPDFYAKLEHAFWALQARQERAAYLLGIAAGRRLAGGAR